MMFVRFSAIFHAPGSLIIPARNHLHLRHQGDDQCILSMHGRDGESSHREHHGFRSGFNSCHVAILDFVALGLIIRNEKVVPTLTRNKHQTDILMLNKTGTCI